VAEACTDDSGRALIRERPPEGSRQAPGIARQIGERAVMHEQLHHLAEVSERPNIELQILPLSGQHVTSAGPLMSLRIPDFGDVVYLEDFSNGHLYIDDAALIYQHTLVFEKLSQASLDFDDSRQLIRRTADELWTSARG
jgi:hypothetical protein